MYMIVIAYWVIVILFLTILVFGGNLNIQAGMMALKPMRSSPVSITFVFLFMSLIALGMGMSFAG